MKKDKLLYDAFQRKEFTPDFKELNQLIMNRVHKSVLKKARQKKILMYGAGIVASVFMITLAFIVMPVLNYYELSSVFQFNYLLSENYFKITLIILVIFCLLVMDSYLNALKIKKGLEN